MEWAASEGVVSLQWHLSGASQVVLVVKNPSANAGDKRFSFHPWVGKNPLEKGMTTHSTILAWIIPWTEETGEL